MISSPVISDTPFFACAFAYTMRLNKTATRALSNVQGGRTREWDSRTFETHYILLVFWLWSFSYVDQKHMILVQLELTLVVELWALCLLSTTIAQAPCFAVRWQYSSLERPTKILTTLPQLPLTFTCQNSPWWGSCERRNNLFVFVLAIIANHLTQTGWSSHHMH